MIGIPKNPRYRNGKILDHAEHVERCTFCGHWAPRGSIVAAHSNQSRHGKAAGMKAHDCFIAYLCWPCHNAVDADRQDQEHATLIWNQAHAASIPLFTHLLTARGWELLKEHSCAA